MGSLLQNAMPMIGAAGTVYGGIRRYKDARQDKRTEQELRKQAIGVQQAGMAADGRKLDADRRNSIATTIFKQAEQDEAALANPALVLDEAQRATYLRRAQTFRSAGARYLQGDDSALSDVYNANSLTAPGAPSQGAPMEPAGPNPMAAPSPMGPSVLSAMPNPLSGVPVQPPLPVGPEPTGNPLDVMAARFAGNPLAAQPTSQALGLDELRGKIAETGARTDNFRATTAATNAGIPGITADSKVKVDTVSPRTQQAYGDLGKTEAETEGIYANTDRVIADTKRTLQMTPLEVIAQQFGNITKGNEAQASTAALPFAGPKAEAEVGKLKAGTKLDDASADLVVQSTPARVADIKAGTGQKIASTKLTDAQRRTEEVTRNARVGLLNSQRNYNNVLASARSWETNQSKKNAELTRQGLQVSIKHTEALTKKLANEGLIPAALSQEWEALNGEMRLLSNSDPDLIRKTLEGIKPRIEDIQRRTDVVVLAQQAGLPQYDATLLVRILGEGVKSRDEVINAYRQRLQDPDPSRRITAQQLKSYQRAISEAFDIWAGKPPPEPAK